MKLSYLLLAIVLMLVTRGTVTNYPPVYALVEDDYPYQCSCDCAGVTTPVSVCLYDKVTGCYCDVSES